MSPRVIQYEDAALLAKAGLFARGELIGVDRAGCAFYQTSRPGVISARLSGIRPEGTEPVNIRLAPVF